MRGQQQREAHRLATDQLIVKLQEDNGSGGLPLTPCAQKGEIKTIKLRRLESRKPRNI